MALSEKNTSGKSEDRPERRGALRLICREAAMFNNGDEEELDRRLELTLGAFGEGFSVCQAQCSLGGAVKPSYPQRYLFDTLKEEGYENRNTYMGSRR